MKNQTKTAVCKMFCEKSILLISDKDSSNPEALPIGVIQKKYSENILQIYRRTT